MTARRLLALVAVALASLVGASPALAESSDVTDADVALRLGENGELLVTETLTFDYNGTFEGSYRDIELLHGEQIRGVRFSEDGDPYRPGGNTTLGSSDQPDVFGTEKSPGRTRIVWHFRATNEERTFQISYRVVDAAVAYDDVIDIGWTVWGNQWDFSLDRLTASFTDPALDPDDDAYRVWGYPRDVEGVTERGAGEATLEAERVPSNTAVEFRVTLPRTPGESVTAMRSVEGDGLAKILEQEQTLDDEHNTLAKRVERWAGHNAVLISLLIAALAALAAFALTVLARERKTSVPEYLPEPPDDSSPALAYALAHEGDDSTDTVLATLLDLVERGYYRSEQKSTEKEELDIALHANEGRPEEKLSAGEGEVLKFFDKLLDGGTLALSEMRDKIPKHSNAWRNRWEKMTAALDGAEQGELSWDRDLRGWRLGLVVVAVVLFALTALASNSVEDKWLAPVLIGAITVVAIMAIPSRHFRRISADHIERCARWRAFERWTEDFPRLSDDPPATLDLWKRILVFGVAFGTAERMIASGRIPPPVLEASHSDANWTNAAFTGSLASDSFSGSAFSSGFASQVAPESSSSGGGGGFSGGGGGGFSGGGGGGSW